MKKKLFLLGILFSMCTLVTISVRAVESADALNYEATLATVTTGSCGNNATWSFDDSTGVLTISGSGVASIPKNNDNSVLAIVVEEGITQITGAATTLQKCESISLPESLESINANLAFKMYYSLKEITLPAKLTFISSYAFYDCTSLEKVIFKGSVETIPSGIFINCSSLKTVVISEGTTSIADQAFYGCTSLTDVYFPSTVTSISSSSFQKANVSVTVHGTMGSYVETYCTENGKYFSSTAYGEESSGDDEIESVNWSYDESTATLTFFGSGSMPGGLAGEQPWIEHMSELKHVVINEGITTVSGYAFKDCKNLVSVVIPDGVLSFGPSAFSGCSSLENMRIPASLKTIESGCFYGCTGFKKIEVDDIAAYCKLNINPFVSSNNAVLYSKGEIVKHLVIPEGVVNIPEGAFRYCSTFETISLPDSLKTIGTDAFSACKSLREVDFPKSMTQIGYCAFRYCYALERIGLYSSVKFSAAYVFADCPKLKRVDIDSIETFLNCTGYGSPLENGADLYIGGEKVTELVIPSTVTTLNGYLLRGCTSIKKLTIPSSIKAIPAWALSNFINLEELILEEGVESVGDSAFEGCVKLSSISIPSTVTSITQLSFANCYNISEISVAKGNSKYTVDEYGALLDSGKTKILCYPSASKNETYTIPATVTNIYYSLYRCVNLKSINVEAENSTYYSDENGVLYSADKKQLIKYPPASEIHEFIVPETVTKISDYAFFGANNLKRLYVGDNVSVVTSALSGITSGSLTVISGINSPASLAASSNKLNVEHTGKTLNVLWHYSDGVLTLSGEGATDDYMYDYNAPWYKIRDNIKKLVVEDGVTAIGTRTFMNCPALNTVLLPNTLLKINEYSFSNCSALESITLPDSLEFMEGAFIGCTGLRSVNIPSKVKSLVGTFKGCTAFEEFKIPEGVENIRTAFTNCTGLKAVSIPTTIENINDCFVGCTSLERINVSDVVAFSDIEVLSHNNPFLDSTPDLYCNGELVTEATMAYTDDVLDRKNIYSNIKSVKKIIISEGITRIEYMLSSHSFVEYIELPSTLSSIESMVFLHCYSLKGIYVSEDSEYYANDEDGILYTKDMTTLVKYPYNIEASEYTVPEGVRVIGEYAFAHHKFLKTVDLPTSLHTIDSYAFYISSVEEVDIKDGLVYIYSYVFDGSDITRLYLPETVKRIDLFNVNPTIVGYDDTYAQQFAQNRDLVFESLGERPGIIAHGVFGDNDSLKWKIGDDYTIFISGEGAIPDYETTSKTPWYQYLGDTPSIIIYDGITAVGKNAFAELPRASKIVLASSVKTVGENALDKTNDDLLICAYKDSDGLRYAAENNITSRTIIDFGRAGGTLIWTITDDYTLSVDGTGYMYYWLNTDECPWNDYKPKIQKVELSEGLLDVGAWSLSGCSSLKSLTVPNSVVHIQDYSLNGCTALEELTLPFIGRRRGEEGDSGAVFGSIFGFLGVSGDAAISGGTVQRYTESLDKASYMGAFIPSSIKKVTITDEDFIAYGAFYNCKFEEITLPDDIEYISPYAFYNCSVKSISLPRAIEGIGRNAFNTGLTVNYAGTQGAWDFVDVHSVNKYNLVCNNEANVLDAPEIIFKDVYGGKVVSLSSVDGASIYYTLNGEKPTRESAIYKKPLEFLSETDCVIKFFAVKAGYDASITVSENIIVEKLPAPTSSHNGGIISQKVDIELSCADSEARIRYSTKKNDDSMNFAVYSQPITINGRSWLVAKSEKEGYASSDYSRFYFTDSYVKPAVSTVAASFVSRNSAQLFGAVHNVYELGLYEVYFVYYKKAEPNDKNVIKADEKTFAVIDNLSENTEYCFCIKVINGDKETTGEVLEFTTKSYEIPLSLKLDRDGVRVPVGRKYQLFAEIYPVSAKDKTVVWTSSDNRIATVDVNGIVNTHSEGVVTITATAAESGVSDSCEIIVFDKYAKGELDLSELNIATNTQHYAEHGFTLGDDVTGGNEFMALAYYSRWDGVVLEENDEYFNSYASGENGYIIEDYYLERDADYHLQNTFILPTRKNALDNDEIKNAIKKYGAVASALLYVADDKYLSESGTSYYYYEPWYFANSNHAITIVGWDDKYPKERFATTPEGGGAFIVKNSWGGKFAEDGFFYVSYYDTHLAMWSMPYVFAELETKNNYNNIWQYDMTGPSYKVGYKGSTYAANVFPSNGRALANDELLKAISFHTVRQHMEYEIYIVTNYNGTESLENIGAPVHSGILDEMGYHTVELPKDVLLEKGTRFAVIVRLITDDSKTANMLIEKKWHWGENMVRMDNVGFISADGKNWSEIYDDANICIKAFTDFEDTSRAVSYVYIGNETIECEYTDGDIDNAPDAILNGYHSGGLYADMTDTTRSEFVYDGVLPETYDLRNNNLVTNAKNQGNFGTCWTFAASASLESAVLTRTANGSLYSLLNPEIGDDFVPDESDIPCEPYKLKIYANEDIYSLYLSFAVENENVIDINVDFNEGLADSAACCFTSDKKLMISISSDEALDISDSIANVTAVLSDGSEKTATLTAVGLTVNGIEKNPDRYLNEDFNSDCEHLNCSWKYLSFEQQGFVCDNCDEITQTRETNLMQTIDISKDGKCGTEDIIIIQKAIFGIKMLDYDLRPVDFDNDGKIKTYDLNRYMALLKEVLTDIQSAS